MESVKPPVRRATSQPSHATAPSQEPADELHEGPGRRFLWLTTVPSWLTSMVTHVALLLVLAMLSFKIGGDLSDRPITIQEPMEEIEIKDLPDVELEPDLETTVEEVRPQFAAPGDPIETTEEPGFETPDDFDPAIDPPDTDIAFDDPAKWDVTRGPPGLPPGGFDGRRPDGRDELDRIYNPNRDKNAAAVAAALKWLAAHQCRDGSWNFDHRRGGPSQRDPGSLTDATCAATAIALLPFLGAGQTHQSGRYQETVGGGLVYLVRHMKVDRGRATGSFHEPGGRMYSHGLAAIALTEAYAMTQDEDLKLPAQLALNFIGYAQDPVGGGWRYEPRQAGDTSVVGWQLMALKSGDLAHLIVDPNTVRRAVHFLDSSQSDSGSSYGYTGPGHGNATTAIGLLCRMYTGWKRDTGALQRGVERLSNIGPSKHNMYYNYYASQVLRHNALPSDDASMATWRKWDDAMSGYLRDTQSHAGVEAGSWFFGRGEHGAEKGGRLYHTAMAAMILEVYYRHMPIYRQQVTEEDFKL